MEDFVTPETVRLPISGGKFIDVRKRLTHGETEDMYARWSPYVTSGEPAQFNRREVRTGKVLAYLLGWSLTKAGVPVPMSPLLDESARLDTLRGLDPARFTEIYLAIDAHEDAVEQERAAQKKILDGLPVAEAISTSPAPAVGASSGSVN